MTWVPHPSRNLLCGAKVGVVDACTILFGVPKGRKRFHGGGEFHFITCSCYRRRQFLKSARRRDLFLKSFEEVRSKYNFIVAGYVVMPEHFHLLIGEPAHGTVATVMQVLKQRVARKSCDRSGEREIPISSYCLRTNRAPQFWQEETANAAL